VLWVKSTSKGGAGLVCRVPVGAVVARPEMVTVRCEVCDAVDRMEHVPVVGRLDDAEKRRDPKVKGEGEGSGGKEKGLVGVKVGEVVVVMLSSWSGGRVVRGLMGDVWESRRGLVAVGE